MSSYDISVPHGIPPHLRDLPTGDWPEPRSACGVPGCLNHPVPAAAARGGDRLPFRAAWHEYEPGAPAGTCGMDGCVTHPPEPGS